MRTPSADAATEAREGPVILCTLSLPDGRTIRAATRPVVVSATVGGPWLYDALLGGIEELADAVDIFALDATAALSQARVEVTLDDDASALADAWHHLAAATAEVALAWEGETWERRRVLLRGPVQAMEIGRAGEPSSFAVEAAPVATSAVVGDDTRDIGTDYPPTLLDRGGDDMTDVSGEVYPVILGSPLRVPAYKVGEVTAGTNRLVVAGHHVPGTPTVPMYSDGVSAGSFALANGSVTSGDICYADQANQFWSPESLSTPNGAYTVDFTGGGIARADNAAAATKTAADVVRWLLAESGILVDWRRMDRALDLLASWPIGLAVTQQSSCVDVLRDLADLLPIIEVPGADGTWFAYADPLDMPIEGTLTLGAELVGGMGRVVVSDRDAVRNAFTMSYFIDGFTGNFLESVTVDADTSAICALSEQVYQSTLADDVIECRWIWDAVTARRALLARAGRLAMQRRSRQYLLAPDAYHVEAGRSYLLTDSEYNITGRRCVVREVTVTAPFIATIDLVDRTVTSAL